MPLKHLSHNILSPGLIIGSLLGVLVSGCAPKATTFTYEQPGSQQCEGNAEPRQIGNEDNLSVWSYRGRLYVFGSQEVGRSFKESPRMAAGFLDAGAGPAGEDVIFAADDAAPPGFVEKLRERYRRTPKLLRRVGRVYSVWKRGERLFVLGPNPTVEREFVRSGELIISKTFFDTGPHGETVVVEANKDNNQFADQLMELFNARPVLIEKRCPDYFVWKENGRFIVLGSVESSLRLETGRELPETQGVIGAGTQGETVTFETDTRHPALFRRLTTAYFGNGKVPQGLLPD